MKKRRNNIKRMQTETGLIKLLILPALAALSFFANACSYGMDMLEGAITERASFSIDASYSGSSDTLYVSWDKTGSGEDFAGFEVYMTTTAWDEYGDYKVIAARINLYPSLPSWIDFETDSYLGNKEEGSASISVHSPAEEGEYYVRVGMLNFEKKNSDSDNPVYYGVSDYDNHTYVDKVSGYQAVYIY